MHRGQVGDGSFCFRGSALVALLWLASASAESATPSITGPPAGAATGSNRPDITWADAPHDAYEVHICREANPEAPADWDSGVIWVPQPVTAAMSGPLVPGVWYSAFVRLHHLNAWSPWSEGRLFYVAGRLLNDPQWVGDDPGLQWPHQICHNPDRNEYLVSFPDTIPDNPNTPESEFFSRVSYFVLNAAGERASLKASILDDRHMYGIHDTAVAYDPGSSEYLIVYTGWTGEGTPQLRDHLRAQKVDSQTGQLKDSSYLLFTSPRMHQPRLAYSAASDVFLLTWEDTSMDNEIFATRISGATGQRVGPLIDLTAVENRAATHAVPRWNSRRDEFTVVYQVDASNFGQSWDTFAGRLRAGDGALLSEHVQLAGRPTAEFNTDLAYDEDLDRYLLVFETYESDFTIWGQLLNADCTPFGSRFPIAPRGGSLWATWHPGLHEYLIGWLDCCTSGDYGRRISQVGVPLAEAFRINGDVGALGNWQPIPLANTTSQDYLYAWFNSYNDVWSRRYRPEPMLDQAEPAAVTAFKATSGHGRVSLTWINSASLDSLGTIIRVQPSSPPANAHAGLPLAVVPGLPGQPASFEHMTADRSATYYYAAFAHDKIPNHSAGRAASARPLAAADFDADDDVDQDDFGHFQRCLGGSSFSPAGCGDSDLDGNGVIDQADLEAFEACLRGADQAPGC